MGWPQKVARLVILGAYIKIFTATKIAIQESILVDRLQRLDDQLLDSTYLNTSYCPFYLRNLVPDAKLNTEDHAEQLNMKYAVLCAPEVMRRQQQGEAAAATDAQSESQRLSRAVRWARLSTPGTAAAEAAGQGKGAGAGAFGAGQDVGKDGGAAAAAGDGGILQHIAKPIFIPHGSVHASRNAHSSSSAASTGSRSVLHNPHPHAYAHAACADDVGSGGCSGRRSICC
ncbi:hypothetical protein CVT25_015173 [Psilocybe cyanescens]|uniref:Uncharacterized protein n=1 Tax=Psilocybe cyanescens TaxID=93625 RepID=A0A409XAH1_PSICY|nr:hypothetical protein CVT25_015173 [Psilocybe cyanescens]